MPLKNISPEMGTAIIEADGKAYPLRFNNRAAKRLAMHIQEFPEKSAIELCDVYIHIGAIGANPFSEMTLTDAETLLETLTMDEQKQLFALGCECLGFLQGLMEIAADPEARRKALYTSGKKK